MSINQALGYQQNATDKAVGIYDRMYTNASNNISPYMQAGTDALPQFQQVATQAPDTQWMNALANMDMDSIMADPLTQYLQRQGMEQNARRASAMGMGNSSVRNDWDRDTMMQSALGARDRKYGEYVDLNNMSNQNLSNQYNRLSGLTGMGQNAALNYGNIGSNYANALSGLYTGMANAQSSGLLANSAMNAQQSADKRNALLGFAGAVAPSAINAIWG